MDCSNGIIKTQELDVYFTDVMFEEQKLFPSLDLKTQGVLPQTGAESSEADLPLLTLPLFTGKSFYS